MGVSNYLKDYDYVFSYEKVIINEYMHICTQLIINSVQTNGGKNLCFGLLSMWRKPDT